MHFSDYDSNLKQNKSKLEDIGYKSDKPFLKKITIAIIIKFLMWLHIVILCMIFGGWTRAFLVRKSQGNWFIFTMPTTFWISTVVVIVSSLTMMFTIKALKKSNMARYRMLFGLTTFLGIAFIALQFLGFYEMHMAGINLASTAEGVSGSFIYVVSIVHLVHMSGGVIALLIYYLIMRFRCTQKVNSDTGLKILGTYWYFVHFLWLYLFIFFYINQK
jgi:cytochrome c oxidase subunit 3